MKKSLKETNPPPVLSSSEEETDDSDNEKTLPLNQKSKPALEPEKPLNSKAEESSEDETEDEEETDDEQEAAKSNTAMKTPEPAAAAASMEDTLKKTPEPAATEASMDTEGESSSEEETDDSDNENTLPLTQKSNPALQPKKPLKSKAEESSNDETDDETEGDEESDDEQEAAKSDTAKKTPDPATTEASMESDAEGKSSSEEETDDSDNEKTLPLNQKSKPALQPKKPLNSKAEESSEDETEDEEESDDEQEAAKSAAEVESRSDGYFVAALAPAAVKVTGKRAPETQLNGKVKKSKGLSKEVEGEDKKKSGGIIRWTENDEITVLNGLIQYKSEKGSDLDLSSFPDFLKGSIRSDISESQLREKIKRLRRKFLATLAKSENGKDISKPHDLALFNLSKEIWNSASKKTSKKAEGKKTRADVAPDEPIRNKTNEVIMEENELGVDLQGLDEILRCPNMSKEDSKKFFQKNMEKIGSSKLQEIKEINDRWKKLQIKEFKIYAEQMALKSKLSSLMLGAMES